MIEILLTGLCILDIKVANAVEFFCPEVAGHEARMYVEASRDATWDPGSKKFQWAVGLDGIEMFAFGLNEIESIQFIGADGQIIPPGAVTVAVAGLMEPDDLKMAYNRYTKASGSRLPTIKLGSIVESNIITHTGSSDPIEYCLDDNHREIYHENAKWVVADAVKIEISFNDKSVLTVPVPYGADKLRAVASNDAISVSGGRFDLGYRHWDVCSHHGKPLQCCPQEDLFGGSYKEPVECRGQLTSKPICNLLVVK